MKRTLLVVLFSFAALQANAQDANDLRIFGFFQAQLAHVEESGIPTPSPRTSFSIQQLNGFLAKQFNPSFSAFVNVELTNSFSSEQQFGALKLEEAWARYNHSSAFNVKLGLLVPTFNNLNDIKNRTPLLPYIQRPIVYEASLATLLPISDFVPQQAYAQVYGAIPIGDISLDYAAYAGNSEYEFLASEEVGTAVPGTDTTEAKLFGGRLGMRWNNVKLGVSGSVDKDNQSSMGLGAVDRTRFGIDLSYTGSRVFAEGEYIMLSHDLNDVQQATLDAISAGNPVVGSETGKSFYYGMLGANITDQVFAYGMYSHYEDQLSRPLEEGIDMYGAGVGFRPINEIALKAQYSRAAMRENPYLNYKADWFLLGASVLF